jgi:hypothetical protein
MLGAHDLGPVDGVEGLGHLRPSSARTASNR